MPNHVFLPMAEARGFHTWKDLLMPPDTSLSPTVAEIDLTAFAHNIQMVRACLPSTCQILAVVKADAYGHGAAPLSRVAQQQGVAYLGVARCSEGVTLRQQGITAPILVLGPTWSEEVETLVAHRLTPSISSSHEAMAVQHEARKHGLSYAVHVKIDTGMHRFGMAADKVRGFLADMRARPNLSITGLMSHLATADAPETHVVQQQLDAFTQVQHTFAAQGITPQYVHIANSAGLCRYPASHGTLVRPGILLYGSCPFVVLEAPPVRPVLTWTTRLVRVQEVPAGSGDAATSGDTVPARGEGINPRGPSTRPKGPTKPIMSGAAIQTSNSSQPSFIRCQGSLAHHISSGLFGNLRQVSLAKTATLWDLPMP